MVFRRTFVCLLMLTGLTVAPATFADGQASLSPAERDMLMAPELAAQAAMDKVDVARVTLERAREQADPTDSRTERYLRRAAHHLVRAERALATGNYRRAYMLARRVEALRLSSTEVQQ